MDNDKQYNISSLIVTITTLIFAITSTITVYISLSAWREEQESVRPYITFHNSPQVYFNENNQLVFSFKLSNVGSHPAASLHTQTIIVNSKLDRAPLHIDQYSLVNYIPQNAFIDVLVKIPNENTNQNDKEYNYSEHYIVLTLKYSDPVLEKSYEQIIYLKWFGAENSRSENRKLHPIFHASKDDKDRILQYLRKI